MSFATTLHFVGYIWTRIDHSSAWKIRFGSTSDWSCNVEYFYVLGTYLLGFNKISKRWAVGS